MFDDFKPELGQIGRTPPKKQEDPLPAVEDPTLVYWGGPLEGQRVEVGYDEIMGDWPERLLDRWWHAEHEIVFVDQYNKRVSYGDLFNTRVKALPYIYSLNKEDGRWRWQQGMEGEGWNLFGRVAFGH